MKQKMKADILACCNDDYCDLSFIIGVIHDYEDLTINKKEKVLKTIYELLDEKLLISGVPIGGGGEFNLWKGSVDEIIFKIKKEWDVLGKDPQMWEIVWFDITSEGKVELKELLKTVKFEDDE